MTSSPWSSKPFSSQHDYNPLTSAHPPPISSSRSGAVQHDTIATRINQLQEICQLRLGFGGLPSTLPRRRENSRSGFGKRKSSAFAGPTMRNARLNEQPQTDGTHSYLGTNTTRTNHLQDHATVRTTANWEKTAGLHAQMQPMGLVIKANEPTSLWTMPLKINNYSPTRPRKYDRNGDLILDRCKDTIAEPGSSRSQVECGHVSKFPSLSTVLESQLIDPQDISSLQDNYRGSMQKEQCYQTETAQSSHFSSSHKSMPHETPLSAKKRNVRDMYDYYGIKRPVELSSEYGTLEDMQPIRIERNCHICGWINGPDTKCWKCMHRFCNECDDISPKAFFHKEESFPLEDFATNSNPIKLSSGDMNRSDRDLGRVKLAKREDSFPLQYPCINVPEATNISSPKDTNIIHELPTQDSFDLDDASPQSRRKSELSKVMKPSTGPLSSKFTVNTPKVYQSEESMLRPPTTALPTRTQEAKPSSYPPLPIYIQDVPRRLAAAAGRYSTVSRPSQAKIATTSPTKSKQARLDLRHEITQLEQTNLQKKRQEATTTTTGPSQNFKSSAPKDFVSEGQHNCKTEEGVDCFLESTLVPIGRNGSHRHRRTRRHTSGSESNSSSSDNYFSCDSPGCRATHTGHQPYRHSISCMRRKYRCAKDTDSGYIASRSHNDDSLKVLRRRVVKKQATECLQCYGYLNDCPCSNCQSIKRLIMKQEGCSLQPAKESSGETEVFMPQQQNEVSPEKLDAIQTVRDTPNSRYVFDETSLAPMSSVQETKLTDKDTRPSSTIRKISPTKMLNQPISLGYEPAPKLPLYTITYVEEETSELPSVPRGSKQEIEQQVPITYLAHSDFPTPMTEKATQESFFAAVSPRLVGVGFQPKAQAKISRESESELGKSSKPQQQPESSTTHSRITAQSRLTETSLLEKLPPTPASHSLSAILERDSLRALNQKLQQQQYELERITKMFRDHLAETSQPSTNHNATSIIEKRESEKKSEEKETKKEATEKRAVPWRLKLFDRKLSLEQPDLPVGMHALEECIADDPVVQEDINVASEAEIQASDTARQQGSEYDIDRDTPTPKIVVREPTLVPVDTVSAVEAERKKSLVRDSNVMRIARAFSPLGFSFGSPKSSPKADDTQQQAGKESKESENDAGALQPKKPPCQCNCGILGVTIVIHLEDKEDVVFRADLNARVQ